MYNKGDKVKNLVGDELEVTYSQGDGVICKNKDNEEWIYVIDELELVETAEEAKAEEVKLNIPDIEIIYDEKLHSVFVVINKKVTICIPSTSKFSAENAEMSIKHDNDKYNEEIGMSLAFVRSIVK